MALHSFVLKLHSVNPAQDVNILIPDMLNRNVSRTQSRPRTFKDGPLNGITRMKFSTNFFRKYVMIITRLDCVRRVVCAPVRTETILLFVAGRW